MGTGDGRAAVEARLEAAAEVVEELRAVEAKLAVNERQTAEEADRVLELESRLGYEDEDVARLEGLTWTRLLESVRGTREGSLERERAERDAAELQLAAARVRVVGFDTARAALEARRSFLLVAAADRDAALGDLDLLLAAEGDEAARARVDATEELGTVRGQRKEVDEALAAGRSALTAMDDVLGRLSSARSWSTYDTWFGGGMIASAVKHERLDQAAAATSAAARALADLRLELADVPGVGEVSGQLASASNQRFLDVWLDNIFTDFSVSGRIADALAAATTARRQVDAVLGVLTARATELAERAAALDRILRDR